jgi:hypothetical protein
MALSAVVEQLKKIGQMLNRWRAEILLTAGLAVMLILLFGLAWSDFLARYSRDGRLMAWSFLLLVLAVLVWIVKKTLSRRHTPEGVAVCVEQTFPELDNHLINFLQFSTSTIRDAFMATYVKMDIPHWDGLNLSLMKDRRTLRRAQLALGVAVVLLVLPFAFLGQAWLVSMVRVLNPFAEIAPVSLTHILNVSPGDATVLQGGDITLSCTVKGKSGHEVRLDVFPADGELKTYKLGTIKGADSEVFPYALNKVTTGLKYRFRAGDAYFAGWKEITLRPPLAFNSLLLKVIPPSYMGLPARKYDGQSKAIDIPYGSKTELATACNTPLRSLILSGAGAPLNVELKGESLNCVASFIITNGGPLTLAAVAKNGDTAEAVMGFNLLPDRSPVIAVKYPQKPVFLPPGSAPRIDFSVSDDFGFSEITIEQLSSPGDTAELPKVLKSYSRGESKGKDLSFLWKGDIRRTDDTGCITLRVVAKDNRAGSPNVTVSLPLSFELDEMSAAAKNRLEELKKNAEGLNKVIELQRENIDRTKQLQGNLIAAKDEQWNERVEQQELIRKTVRLLIEKGGVNALGNLVATVKKLYVNEMAEVIPALRKVPEVKDVAAKDQQVVLALSMEEKILRQLTFAEESAKKVQEANKNSSLIGILDGIITGQADIIKTTLKCAAQNVAVAPAIVTHQDKLSSELIAFIKACRAEASSGQGEDKGQAAFVESVATFCEKEKISNDMLLASEQLEGNKANNAVQHERNAYAKLQAARKQFEEVLATGEKETRQEMIEAIKVAEGKLEKLKDLTKKLKEEMDKIEDNKNKNTKDFDVMEEQAAEIEKNIKEAMLQIPRDLDIFAHLNVGNDLVEDVFSTFEEVKQAAGSGKPPPGGGPVSEKAVIKREELLGEMEKATKLLDDFEMWLGKEPDTKKITVEAADKEEMPEGVALTPLQTSMEDIIGDLLKVDEKLAKEADDGAINAAVPDMEMGGEIKEGDTTTFSAKGKSGNQAPDHKEQDGRSNVGRQGMSSGETAAGSGTIGKGDDAIEARRTQDPTQAGQVMADGEADTKATGGGKLGSGKGDAWGDGGGTDRMDSSEAGTWATALENMAKKTDQAYAQASMKGLRTDSLEVAAHHIRQTTDTIAKGGTISQVAELRRKAIGALKKAKTELGEGSASSLDGQNFISTLSDVIEADQELSPEKYRKLNAEYYKTLNEVM